jgi:hypothetical protein
MKYLVIRLFAYLSGYLLYSIRISFKFFYICKKIVFLEENIKNTFSQERDSNQSNVSPSEIAKNIKFSFITKIDESVVQKSIYKKFVK